LLRSRALAALPDETAIDGEVIAYGANGRPSFNVLQNYRGAGADELHLYAFYLLTLRGRDLTREPLEARREILRAEVMPLLPDSIRYSETLGNLSAQVFRFWYKPLVGSAGVEVWGWRISGRSHRWRNLKQQLRLRFDPQGADERAVRNTATGVLQSKVRPKLPQSIRYSEALEALVSELIESIREFGFRVHRCRATRQCGEASLYAVGDNPLHFCSQPKNHPGTCGCKCGAIEGIAGASQSRNKTRQESHAGGSDGSDPMSCSTHSRSDKGGASPLVARYCFGADGCTSYRDCDRRDSLLPGEADVLCCLLR
jgi:hypothetical protein